MKTATMNKKTKPQRTMRFIQTGLVNLLWINQGKQTDGYMVEELSNYHNSGAVVYRMTKSDGTAHDVLLDGPGSLCDCKGFEYRGMNTKDGKGCKHVAALTRLAELGRI
jgi:hypothetical protein